MIPYTRTGRTFITNLFLADGTVTVPTPTLPVPIPGRDREVRLDIYSRHDPNEYYVWRLNTIEINKPGLGQG